MYGIVIISKKLTFFLTPFGSSLLCCCLQQLPTWLIHCTQSASEEIASNGLNHLIDRIVYIHLAHFCVNLKCSWIVSPFSVPNNEKNSANLVQNERNQIILQKNFHQNGFFPIINHSSFFAVGISNSRTYHRPVLSWFSGTNQFRVNNC